VKRAPTVVCGTQSSVEDSIYTRRVLKHRLFMNNLRTLGNSNTDYNEDLFGLERNAHYRNDAKFVKQQQELLASEEKAMHLCYHHEIYLYDCHKLKVSRQCPELYL
jgi:hypothetical protein